MYARDRERQKYRTQNWTDYDPVHKRYLDLGKAGVVYSSSVQISDTFSTQIPTVTLKRLKSLLVRWGKTLKADPDNVNIILWLSHLSSDVINLKFMDSTLVFSRYLSSAQLYHISMSLCTLFPTC